MGIFFLVMSPLIMCALVMIVLAVVRIGIEMKGEK